MNEGGPLVRTHMAVLISDTTARRILMLFETLTAFLGTGRMKPRCFSFCFSFSFARAA